MKTLPLVFSSTLVLVFLLFTTSVMADDSWDCIIQRSLDKLENFDFGESYSKKELTAMLILYDADTNIKKAEEFLSENEYNPIIISLYLICKIQTNEIDRMLIKYLKEFKKNEENNSYPLYLLSYYYAKKGGFDKSMKYLIYGNKISRLNRFLKEKSNIVVECLLEHGLDETVAYASQVNLYARDSYKLFRELSYALLQEKDDQIVRDEIKKLARVLDQNSYSLLDKLFANSIFIDAIKGTENQSEYEALISERNKLQKLTDRIHSNLSKNELLEYLHKMKDYGEIGAIKKVFGKNGQFPSSSRKQPPVPGPVP